MALMTEKSEYLTTDEVGRQVRLSRPTVIQLIERGELKASRFGKVWRIKKSDLEAYIRQQTNVKVDESSSKE
jgi:excisionase family DNA binding protein